LKVLHRKVLDLGVPQIRQIPNTTTAGVLETVNCESLRLRGVPNLA